MNQNEPLTYQEEKEKEFIIYRDILYIAVTKKLISWPIFEATLIEIRRDMDLPICTHCKCELIS